MLLESGPQRDLVILQNVNCRDVKHSRQIHTFVESRSLCRAISDPCKNNGVLSPLFDGESHACEYRGHCSNLTGRTTYAVALTAGIQVSAFTGRIRCSQ